MAAAAEEGGGGGGGEDDEGEAEREERYKMGGWGEGRWEVERWRL